MSAADPADELTWPEPDPSRDIELHLPPRSELIRVARLAVSGLGSMCGFDVDGLDDMKIAVDELCATLMELSDGSAVIVRLSMLQPGGMAIDATTRIVESASIDAERAALGERILEVITDRHELTVGEGSARFRVMRLCEPIDPEPVRTDAGGADG